MEHRPFGQTGLDVSAIGFGCWEIGGGYGSIEAEEFPRAIGRALDGLVKDGKIRFVGLSNFKKAEIEACMKIRRVDVVQYGWHLFDRRMQREIFPYCHENGIGVMAYGSLAFGLLTGTFTAETTFAKDDWRSRAGGSMAGMRLFDALFGAEAFPRNLQIVDELKAIAAKYDRSLPQLALRWAISHPAVSTSLVGCRSVAEVEDNARAVEF